MSSPKLRGIFGQNRKFKRFFSPKTSDLQKKRSSPKLRSIIPPKSEIQMNFQAESQHLLHNFGTQIPLGGGAVVIFSAKIGLKIIKNVRFCILNRPMGGARARPPGYATVSKLTSRQTNTIQDEINGSLWQPKNNVNLIRYRHSCDKFKKFGAEVHLCGKIKTSGQKKLFGNQF